MGLIVFAANFVHEEFATTREKEWYFYYPRDRKYKNNARPNRVTRVGFWKATGTDKPIYSSKGSKCIGLKKFLVDKSIPTNVKCLIKLYYSFISLPMF